MIQGDVKVLTYSDPNTFHHLDSYKSYSDCLHICATSSMTRNLSKKLKTDVISAGEFVDLFYPGWNSTENRFDQYARLSDILRENQAIENQTFLRSFKRNKLDLLITMRNMTEIGMKPFQLYDVAQKEEEIVFSEIWGKMLEYFLPFMNYKEKKLKDEESIKKVLKEAEFEKINTLDTLVLHGFYYISPVQHHLFTILKEKGFNLIFLNLYNKDFQNVFSFLDKNFSEENGWASSDSWIVDRSSSPIRAEKFAEKLEGADTNETIPGVKVQEYTYLTEFVDARASEDSDDNVEYFSPVAEKINNRLKEFDTGKDFSKHLLSYPIGQYLFHLHTLYDEEESDYYIDGDTLLSMFSSGWLNIDGVDARRYTEKTKKLLPYFDGCKKVDDWEERFERLKLFKKKIDDKYSDIEGDGILTRIRQNQFLRFSFFSISYDEIATIQSFFGKVIKDARWIVDVEEERFSIREHFNRIQQILEDSIQDSSLFRNEEKELVENLRKFLQIFENQESSNEVKYNVNDLAETLTIYLGEGFEPDDERLVLKDVNSLEQLDGLIHTNKEKIHITALDERNFPMKSVPMPWPLNIDTVKNLNNPAMNMYLFRKEHQLAISRYLFFTSLCFNQELVLSWITNWDGEENIGPSIYLNTIEQGEKKEDYLPEYKLIDDFEYDLEVAGGRTDFMKAFPQEEKIEAALCPRRFFYSTILEQHSTYNKHFHQSFLIGNLIKQAAAAGKSRNLIFRWLKEIFPNFSSVRLSSIMEANLKDNIIEGYRNHGGKTKIYNGRKYSSDASDFQFLMHRGAQTDEIWKKAFETNAKPNDEKIKQRYLPEAVPSALCKFCPHASYCEKSIFPVDTR